MITQGFSFLNNLDLAKLCCVMDFDWLELAFQDFSG